MIDEKTCTHCRVTKSVGAFGKHTRSKDGLQCWCKECKREHYQANKSTVLAQCRVGLFADKPTVPYSPDPWRYDPMCRSCHVKRDSYGAA